VRENKCNIWLKMLDTRVMAAVVLLDGSRLLNANRSRISPLPFEREF
jgi:hypothetical protein